MIVKYASVKKGAIVLVPFPFSDLSGYKTRPALVLGVNNKASRVIVCFIGSRLEKLDKNFDIMIKESHKNFRATGLKIASLIKTDKIASFSFEILYGIIGSLSANIVKQVDNKLKILLSLK